MSLHVRLKDDGPRVCCVSRRRKRRFRRDFRRGSSAERDEGGEEMSSELDSKDRKTKRLPRKLFFLVRDEQMLFKVICSLVHHVHLISSSAHQITDKEDESKREKRAGGIKIAEISRPSERESESRYGNGEHHEHLLTRLTDTRRQRG